MPKDKHIEGYLSLSEASRYAHVTRQCLFLAKKKNLLDCQKIGSQWYVTKEELDRYRGNKYNRDLRRVEGEYVYDVEIGHFSVQQIAKVLSASLGVPYPVQRVYYMMRTGRLKCFRKGKAWIISKQDALELLTWEKEIRAIV